MFDTDQFCIQCGWKVGKPLRCPDCGEELREGARFCPKCGRSIDAHTKSEESKRGTARAETTDIPIADIEQNILFETQRELGAAGTPGTPKSQIRRETRAETALSRRPSPEKELPRKRNAAVIEEELPRRRKTAAVEEEECFWRKQWSREDDLDDEDEDAYDAYEEDDEEEENDGHRLVTIMTVVMAVLIFSILAFIVFRMFVLPGKENYDVDEGYEEEGEASSQDDTSAEEQNGQSEGGAGASIEENISVVGTLSIDTNVNVRDNPSTSGTNVIKVAKAGETYEYVGMSEDENWYCIVLEDGSTGYVYRNYVKAD